MRHQSERRNKWSLALLISSAVFFSSMPTATAQESTSATKIAGASKDEAQIKATYIATFGYKPEFFEDAGRDFEQIMRLSTEISDGMNLSLWGSIVSENEPEVSTEIQDTLIRLTMPGIWKRGQTALQWRASWLAPTSKNSQNKELRGRASTRLALTQQVGGLELAYRVFFRKYLFAETEDATGAANRDYEVKNTGAISYAFAKDFGFSAYATNVNRFFHARGRRDYYETGLDLGYQVTEKLGASAGIATSESQVKDSQQNTAKLYVKDITAASLGLTYSF